MAKIETMVIRRQGPSGLATRIVNELRSFTLGPSSLKDPALSAAFGGRTSAAGVHVDEESSMSFAAVWNAVVLVSGDVAKVPLPLYRRLPDGGKEVYRDHKLYDLIHDEPNEDTSSFKFRQTAQGHVLVWGNSYSEIERDAVGRPVALWPLMPWSVEPFRDAGGLKYKVRQPSGGQVVFDKRDILHLSGLGMDGVTGYPPIRKAFESLGIAVATERFAASFFGNSTVMGGAITYPQGIVLTPEAKADNRKAIEARHKGVDKSHRLLTLYEGATYTAFGVAPNEAQFLETRRFQIEEVARWFNLPVHKLKELARSTNNNIEHQGIEYATDTLQPWFRMWEGELRMKLIPRLERKQQFFEHVTEALTRGDSAAQGSLIGQQFSVGGISPNEIRSKFNMNPRPDGGDIYVPSNTMPADLARKYWEASIEKMKQPAAAPAGNVPGSGDELKALREIIDGELTDARKKAQEWEDRHDVLMAQLQTAQIVGVEAGTARDAAQGKAEHLAAEAHRLQVEGIELRRTIEALESVGADVANALTATTAERDGLAAQVTSLLADIEQRKADTAKTAEAHRLLEMDREAALDIASKAEQERDAALHQMTTELDAAKGREEGLRAELTIVQGEAATIDGVATQRTAERDAALATIGEKDAEAESLRTDLATARAEIATELERRQTQRAVMLTAMRSLFVDTSERLLNKEIDRVRKNQTTPEKLRAWVETFYQIHEDTVRQAFRPLVGPFTAVAGGAPDLLLDRLVREHIEASTQAIRQVLDADDPDAMAGALERTIRRWETERADTLADKLVREGIGDGNG